MASSSSLLCPPEGIVVHRHWRIGKKLGAGVCGSVHELVRDDGDGTTNNCAIKLAPLPNYSTTTANAASNAAANPGPKVTKKENVERKTYADILHYESLVYQNQLVDLRGTLIPELPLRPATGDVEGYRYLILEKMAASFDQVIADIASGTRSFATVATHLITLVEEVHNRKLLVIDIKPDNFMVTSSGKIVMIDLGLVQSYGSMGGHRPNNTARTSGVVGTPLYASLHLFQGDTPSRRDDLEALLYLLIEVVLKIATGSKASKGTKQLPWSEGRSEHEIGELKKQCMTDESATLWKTLGPVAGPALRSFFEHVHHLGYSKKPDYDVLRNLVQVIELGGKKKKAGATKAKSSTTSRAGTARASRTQDTTNAIVTTSARSSATSRRAAGASDTQTNMVGTTKKRPSPNKESGRKTKKLGVVDEHDDDDGFYTVQNTVDDDFHSCNSDAMDWELVKDAIGVTLEIVSGPHEGEMINLIDGQRETVVFGLRPDVVDGYDLAGDSDVDLAHAKVTLQVTKKVPTVVVTDLKSSAGTRVTKYLLPPGKSQKAFLNDIITIGETSIKVLPLKSHAASMGSPARVEIMNVPDVDMQDATEKENSTPSEKGLLLALVEGPLSAPSMYLRPGEAKIVGSKGDYVVKDADPSHLKLTLHVTRQMMSVQVKDLRSKSGTYINGNKVQEGKLFIGDSLKVGDCTWKVAKDDSDLKQLGTTKTMNAVASATARGFRLEFTAGPHKGKHLVLQDAQVETIVMGANPRPRSGTAFKLDNDPSITDASHIRIELDAATQHPNDGNSLTVTDLKSATGIRLNDRLIGKGKKETAFVNDRIVVGASTIRIQPL